MSWSPYGVVFNSSESGDTVLLGVGNGLTSLVGGSTKLIDLGVVLWSAFKVVI